MDVANIPPFPVSFPLMKFTDFVIEIQTFSFASLVIVGLNLPLMTVVFFPASCMISWTSSGVKFRFLSFLTTVRDSFFFFVFPFPDAALTMVIDVAWSGSGVARSASEAAMVIEVAWLGSDEARSASKAEMVIYEAWSGSDEARSASAAWSGSDVARSRYAVAKSASEGGKGSAKPEEICVLGKGERIG